MPAESVKANFTDSTKCLLCCIKCFYASGAEERRQRPLCQREGQSDQGEEQEAAISGAAAVGVDALLLLLLPPPLLLSRFSHVRLCATP